MPLGPDIVELRVDESVRRAVAASLIHDACKALDVVLHSAQSAVAELSQEVSRELAPEITCLVQRARFYMKGLKAVFAGAQLVREAVPVGNILAEVQARSGLADAVTIAAWPDASSSVCVDRPLTAAAIAEVLHALSTISTSPVSVISRLQDNTVSIEILFTARLPEPHSDLLEWTLSNGRPPRHSFTFPYCREVVRWMGGDIRLEMRAAQTRTVSAFVLIVELPLLGEHS